jgi:hypothetical protein
VQFWMLCLVLGAGLNKAVVLASVLYSNMVRNCVVGGNFAARGIPRCLLLYSRESSCMSTSPKRLFLAGVFLSYHYQRSCKQSGWKTWWEYRVHWDDKCLAAREVSRESVGVTSS